MKFSINRSHTRLLSRSRMNIEAYHHLDRELSEGISRINQQADKILGRPIIVEFAELSQEQLQTVRQLADVFLVTSYRDGLHLGPIEFIAAQQPNCTPKTMILSQGAGIAEYFPDVPARNYYTAIRHNPPMINIYR